jgi:hypothetical protein
LLALMKYFKFISGKTEAAAVLGFGHETPAIL